MNRSREKLLVGRSSVGFHMVTLLPVPCALGVLEGEQTGVDFGAEYSSLVEELAL